MHHFRIVLLTISILSTILIQPSIANSPAVDGQFPWHVLLNIKNKYSEKEVQCEGAIIDPDWIITSAKCLSGAERVDVSVGSILYNVTDPKRIQRTGTVFNVHKKWSGGTGSQMNAIALVKLNQSLQFDMHVKAIKLATGRSVTDNQEVTLSSFGNGNKLEWLSLNILSNQQCEKEWYNNNQTQYGVLCTGYKPTAVCWANDGAPLVNVNEKEAVLVGLAIKGHKDQYISCIEQPILFTNISYFDDWIEENKRILGNGASDLGINLLIVTLASLLYMIVF